MPNLNKLILAFLFLSDKTLASNFPKEDSTCVSRSTNQSLGLDTCFEPWEHCSKKEDEPQATCKHKDLWPLEPFEWFATIFISFWLAACNAGGIGGGSTLVPLIKILFRFSNVYAIGISNSMVTVTGVMRFIIDAPKRHPLKKDLDNKPTGTLMEYNIAIVLLPMGVIGAVIGSIISLLIPMVLNIMIFSLTLAFLMHMTVAKLIRMVKKENLERQVALRE